VVTSYPSRYKQLEAVSKRPVLLRYMTGEKRLSSLVCSFRSWCSVSSLLPRGCSIRSALKTLCWLLERMPYRGSLTLTSCILSVLLSWFEASFVSLNTSRAMAAI
jgi:hypothetical protein